MRIMKIICKKTVKDNLKNTLFTKGKSYEFIRVNDEKSMKNNYYGYFRKDDKGYLRWATAQFIDKYFIY